MSGDFVYRDIAWKSRFSALLPNQPFSFLTNLDYRHVFVYVAAHFFAGFPKNFPRQTKLL